MKIRNYWELEVFKLSFDLANEIYKITKNFPVEEKFSLTDQIRRSSRSVSANIAEAFGARRYPKSFVSKLVIAQCESCETQVWLDFAYKNNYISDHDYKKIHKEYNHIIAMLIKMITDIENWKI